MQFPFNQLNLCPSSTWYLDGVTFANSSLVGTDLNGVYVDRNNTVYVADKLNNRVVIWYEGSAVPNKILYGSLSAPFSLFVTSSGDMYVDNGYSLGRLDKMSINANGSVNVMSIDDECYAIFIDISNTLYCTMTYNNRVAKKWLGDNGTTYTIIAGGGGSSTTLSLPAGLHVDIYFNLYVSDCGNHRIVKFAQGQSQGTIIVGTGASGTPSLYYPNAITVDVNNYIFLTDTYNMRLLGSGPYGYRCLFGCDQVADAAANHLNYPRTFSFDSYGNIYVADRSNNRIQKFAIASNSCSKSFQVPLHVVLSLFL